MVTDNPGFGFPVVLSAILEDAHTEDDRRAITGFPQRKQDFLKLQKSPLAHAVSEIHPRWWSHMNPYSSF